MNPFTTPDRLFISRYPQDMRAGIQRLASIVTADYDMDPTDGALYVFISRDAEKVVSVKITASSSDLRHEPYFVSAKTTASSFDL